MLSDFEYSIREMPTQLRDGHYYVSIIRRLVWGLFNMIPYYVFYKLAIQQLLVKKRYAYFILALIVFLPVLEYNFRLMYAIIARLHFLPKEMISEAIRWNAASSLHFTINYLLLQLLELSALAYYINYSQQEKRLQQLQATQLQQELHDLKTQLQPHFFFNTLNNIYSLALQQSSLTAPLVAQLAEMMRYVLDDAAAAKVSLSREIAFIRNYIRVQSVRYKNQVSIRFDTQCISEQAQIEPLLLLPLIENTFKHGTEEETGSGFIEIIACLQGREFTLSAQNSKAAATRMNDRTGIGIANLKKRLALLYPGRHSLSFDDTPAIFTVLLTIQLHAHNTLPDS